MAWLALRNVPESRDETTTGLLAYAGATLATVGLAGATYAIVEGPSRGLGSPPVLIAAILGIVGLVGFIVGERRIAHAMLQLEIFSSRQFTAANLVTFVVYAALGGVFFLLAVVLQTSLGYSPVAAAKAASWLLVQPHGRSSSHSAARVADVDVSSPHRAVAAGLDGDVLVLLARTTQSMSGREIAERLGLRSHDGVRKALERLVSQGIVLREGSRSAFLHQLNREHLAAAAVFALAGMRAELWQRIRDAVAEWELPPTHASAFGSAARGDGDQASDIDILLVRPSTTPESDHAWGHQVDALRSRVELWTGNRASIVEVGEEALDEMLAQSQPPPVLRAVLREGIDLAGVPARRLLGALRAS